MASPSPGSGRLSMSDTHSRTRDGSCPVETETMPPSAPAAADPSAGTAGADAAARSSGFAPSRGWAGIFASASAGPAGPGGASAGPAAGGLLRSSPPAAPPSASGAAGAAAPPAAVPGLEGPPPPFWPKLPCLCLFLKFRFATGTLQTAHHRNLHPADRHAGKLHMSSSPCCIDGGTTKYAVRALWAMGMPRARQGILTRPDLLRRRFFSGFAGSVPGRTMRCSRGSEPVYSDPSTVLHAVPAVRNPVGSVLSPALVASSSVSLSLSSSTPSPPGTPCRCLLRKFLLATGTLQYRQYRNLHPAARHAG
mmetsp:Transcript_2729/g.6279  ORF Transcript_2729/g.6279 Transcript_2729/m.6279 type:complete len:308 (+) Transcript_2729:423-1346(+)